MTWLRGVGNIAASGLLTIEGWESKYISLCTEDNVASRAGSRHLESPVQVSIRGTVSPYEQPTSVAKLSITGLGYHESLSFVGGFEFHREPALM